MIFHSILLKILLFLGTGAVNQAGIQYYKNLINELHANNIVPMAALYHWDIPTALAFGPGGLQSNKFPEWFAEYARICFKEFGPLVKYWITFNEAATFCESDKMEEYYNCAHNVIKAHAAAYHIYDKEFRPSQQGILISFKTCYGYCNPSNVIISSTYNISLFIFITEISLINIKSISEKYLIKQMRYVV